MNVFLYVILIIVVFFSTATTTLAQSPYVLPYPSAMPGSASYKLHVVLEELSRFWYFGNFGQFDYHLKLSDKYLVEAKTLFEYKQYLLGKNALEKSDSYFKNISVYLSRSKIEGKDTTQRQNMLREAALKHIEVLSDLKRQVPEEFLWRPEKAKESTLQLWDLIENSLLIRKHTIV